MGIGNPKKCLLSVMVVQMELIRHSIREMLHKILRFQLSISRLVFVGRIFYEKGINELVASFYSITERLS